MTTAYLSNIDQPATIVLAVICITVGITLTIIQALRDRKTR